MSVGLVQGSITTANNNNNKEKLRTACTVPECVKEFSFDGTEIPEELRLVSVVPVLGQLR